MVIRIRKSEIDRVRALEVAYHHVEEGDTDPYRIEATCEHLRELEKKIPECAEELRALANYIRMHDWDRAEQTILRIVFYRCLNDIP